MFDQFKSLSLTQKLMLLIVPTIALVIVFRQHYLHQTQNLSIWKGGGMGMFAASDAVSRVVKIYIVTPKGEKHPIIDLTPSLSKLRMKIKFNPSKSNFKELADSLGKTRFIAGNEKFPHRVLDKSGQELSRIDGTYYYLRPAGPRPEGDVPDWQILIEFWDTRYNSQSQIAEARLIERYTQRIE